MADKVRAKLAAVHTKLEGKYVLVYLNFGESATEASPKWAMIGGQKSGDLDLSADSIDASDKTSGGWGEKYPGLLDFSASWRVGSTAMWSSPSRRNSAKSFLSVLL